MSSPGLFDASPDDSHQQPPAPASSPSHSTGQHDPTRPVGLLAGLVARRGERARYLEPDNTAADWADITDASASGRPFFIKVAPWILALDADSAETAVAVEDVATDLVEHGHRPVVVSSGRPGHRHLFVVLANEAHHAHWSALATAAGIDVRRTIRPPLSPHRLGHRSALVYPDTVGEAVDALSPPPDVTGGRRLSANMAALLRHGEHPGRTYASRSEVTQALATGALNAGWTYGRFRNALVDPNNAGGARYRAMLRTNPIEADKWLERSWDKAEAFVGRRPARTEPSGPMLENKWLVVRGARSATAPPVVELVRKIDVSIDGTSTFGARGLKSCSIAGDVDGLGF